jgi:hypothetical protein
MPCLLQEKAHVEAETTTARVAEQEAAQRAAKEALRAEEAKGRMSKNARGGTQPRCELSFMSPAYHLPRVWFLTPAHLSLSLPSPPPHFTISFSTALEEEAAEEAETEEAAWAKEAATFPASRLTNVPSGRAPVWRQLGGLSPFEKS